MGSVGQNSTFSEHGHFTYQIMENPNCSNLVANILPADPLTPQIKYNHEFSSMVASRTPSPDPWYGGSMSKFTFSENGQVAYHITENHKCRDMVTHRTLPTHPPPWGWFKIQLFQSKVTPTEHSNAKHLVEYLKQFLQGIKNRGMSCNRLCLSTFVV